jgi:large subunit ribosomal protein L23
MKHALVPHITEKSYVLIPEDAKAVATYTFRVRPEVTAGQVKGIIEDQFKVAVTDVRFIMLPGKDRRFKGHPGRTQDRRKALVTLKAGDRIADYLPKNDEQVAGAQS